MMLTVLCKTVHAWITDITYAMLELKSVYAMEIQIVDAA